jgi:hypothetical protein
MPVIDFATQERFWEKVARGGDDECWEWQASRNRNGYGKFKAQGIVQNASRVAWLIANDHRGWGIVVRHTCDNPGCCNPAHLISGTQADNIGDMKERGRNRNGRMPGDENPRSKLTASDVKVIRQRIMGGETNRAIARDYPVSCGMISKIRTGSAWQEG